MEEMWGVHWNCNNSKFLVRVVLPLKEKRGFKDVETEDRDL